jgi:sulfate adenylyltransferase large subunit
MTTSGQLLQIEESDFLIDDFLAAEEKKDLLRFSTAGSVDDGKSTLIGRLYDSRNVYEDHLRSVTGTQAGQKQPTIDFAQLTDGLRAEREQGITIDVAYRYFSTQRRKFIIADTPGHEQYTRNMATGASTADLAIILIDARKGILTQSRRHAYIASLLGIRHLVAAINKMDLVDFSQGVYQTIEKDFRELVASFGTASLVTIPVSALDGDNVVNASERMPWYSGPTLLEHLEEVPVWTEERDLGFRLPVQRVIRPDQSYRGFAGQISSGTVRKGDTIVALPSGRTSRIASITTFDGDLEEASAPQSIALTLEDELDISRGDVISEVARQPQHATSIEASLVWFDSHRLESHRPYLLKHGTQMLSSRVTRVLHRTNIHTLQQEAVNSLGMNDIGVVEIDIVRAIFFDPYQENRASGNFILIDVKTNATVAAGMIRRGVQTTAISAGPSHKATLLFVSNSKQADFIEQQLLTAECSVVRTRVQSEQVWRSLLSIGVIVILEDIPTQQVKSALESFNGGAIALESSGSDKTPAALDVPDEFIQRLRDEGVLPLQEEGR